ncbi:hypothetical protein LLE49_19840 [Alicyclobacillus tolerans]|uniref:hypothetical protein n=1 Tax=Alicyclobacillus tolerans TaxID=90970 RepID=UPI001F2147F3|nr:hypothetical protein [Alicyclobacillus tolerans]MCF8566976.1 hypothetical protein [Alicyclobacillus tolerans]
MVTGFEAKIIEFLHSKYESREKIKERDVLIVKISGNMCISSKNAFHLLYKALNAGRFVYLHKQIVSFYDGQPVDPLYIKPLTLDYIQKRVALDTRDNIIDLLIDGTVKVNNGVLDCREYERLKHYRRQLQELSKQVALGQVVQFTLDGIEYVLSRMRRVAGKVYEDVWDTDMVTLGPGVEKAFDVYRTYGVWKWLSELEYKSRDGKTIYVCQPQIYPYSEANTRTIFQLDKEFCEKIYPSLEQKLFKVDVNLDLFERAQDMAKTKKRPKDKRWVEL